MKKLKRRLVRALNGWIPLESRFTAIYRTHKWKGGGEETRSGAGSTLEATNILREQLPLLLEQLNARGLLDIGCGDFNWMKSVELPCPYHGVDIVPHVIAENQSRFERPSVTFECKNAVDEAMPAGYDVILCREVLFHLSFSDSFRMLGNFLESDARYLLLTTNIEATANKDIVSGEFRDINLELIPYSFPPAERLVDDSAVAPGRSIGLWKASSVAAVLSKRS